MSRILIADDSSHAQRMGELILREEGYEVVSATDGESALERLAEADPDVILADALLPGKSGYEICEAVKRHPRHSFVRVILTTGMLEPFDDQRARAVHCDGILKRPFEAAATLGMVRPLLRQAEAGRAELAARAAAEAGVAAPPDADPQRVRAAVILALDAALPKLVDEIAERVLLALKP